MKRILLTAIGGDVSQAVALIIREEFPDWYLVGCDIQERHAGELFVDKYFHAPRADSPDYFSWIESLLLHEKIDICIPLSEAEIIFFSNNGLSSISGASVVMPNLRAVEVGSDKLLTAQFLKESGCPYPLTVNASDHRGGISYPCIFKPRRGAGSKCVFVCDNNDEADFFDKKYPGGILQELLLPEEKEITCAVYRSSNGNIAVIQLLRKLAGGSTVWANVVDFPEIGSLCRKIAEDLDLRGSINLQLRLTDQGPKIFEINPRFSSTVLIRHYMGFQDVLWSLNEVLGVCPDLYVPAEGTVGVKINNAVILNKSKN